MGETDTTVVSAKQTLFLYHGQKFEKCITYMCQPIKIEALIICR